MKIRVDKSKCVGPGNCVDFAPTVFVLNDDRQADILDPHSVDDETLLEAAKSCPVGAIIIEDDSGNQLYP